MRHFGHGHEWGKFLPLHAGHSLLIRAALARCDRVTVVLGARRDEPIPRSSRPSSPPDLDAVCTSEAYGDELAARLRLTHVCVDPARRLRPVSGEAARARRHPVRPGRASRRRAPARLDDAAVA